MTTTIPEEVLGRLREAKAKAFNASDMQAIINARDQVIARYSPMFQPEAIGAISEDAFRSFFYFENNRHWSGLFRQVNRVSANMTATRAALVQMVDETQPLEQRLEAATKIRGLGKGIITAILHVAYPDRYGVWNGTSDGALVALGLMPAFQRGTSFGERYRQINQLLLELAKQLDVDLWTLDALWWCLDHEADAPIGSEAEEPEALFLRPERARAFALERHLHDYLLESWDTLSLAGEWQIFSRPGEPEAGYEFVTPVGRIDLLARHKTERKWLVIELKKDKTSDQVVGQVLRYIGWIRAHLADEGDSVQGLIVAHEGEPTLHYAVSAVPELSFKTYEVEFRLKDGPAFEEFARP